MEDRSRVAKKLIENIKKKPTLEKIIRDMDRVCTALIKLAYTTVKKTRRSNKFVFASLNDFTDPFQAPSGKSDSAKVTMDRSAAVLRLKNMDIPVLTTNIRVRADRDYEKDVAGGWIGLAEYDTAYYMVGGINAPKRIKCLGTDGKWRSQLVKGQLHILGTCTLTLKVEIPCF